MAKKECGPDRGLSLKETEKFLKQLYLEPDYEREITYAEIMSQIFQQQGLDTAEKHLSLEELYELGYMIPNIEGQV